MRRDGWWDPASIMLGGAVGYLATVVLSWTGWGAYGLIIAGVAVGAAIRIVIITRRHSVT